MDTWQFDIAQFVGRFHPLLVHLPIGFLIALVILEVLSLRAGYEHLKGAIQVMAALTVPAVALSIACGYLLSRSGGYDGQLVGLHRNTAYALGVCCLALAVLQWRGWQRAYRTSLLVTVALLGYTSHLGGTLTHGADYLTEHLPMPVKSMLSDKPIVAKPASKALEQPFYVTVVQPGLDRFCVSCHGAEKAKGKLRLDSYEALMKGGDSGPVIAAGDGMKSELIARMELPHDSEDRMPPTGKPQPPAEWVELTRWWIRSGAVSTSTFSQLNPPDNIKAIVTKVSISKP